MNDEMYSEIYDEIEGGFTPDKNFVIDNADSANWALKEINAKRQRFKLYEEVANNEIDKLKEKLSEEKRKNENLCNFLIGCLQKYIERDDIPVKETKTQRTLVLPAGKIIKKLEHLEIQATNGKTPTTLKEDKDFVKSVKEYFPDCIDVKESVKWKEVKSKIQIDDEGNILNTETGEFLDFLKTELAPARVEVKTE